MAKGWAWELTEDPYYPQVLAALRTRQKEK